MFATPLSSHPAGNPQRGGAADILYADDLTASAEVLAAATWDHAHECMERVSREGKGPTIKDALAVQDATVAHLLAGAEGLPPPCRVAVLR